MDISKHISKRVQAVPLGKQTSVAIPGLINMGSGTPDFEPPAFIFDAMRAALEQQQVKYTAWAGTPELRQAAATKLERENGLVVDPDSEIMVTSGAQEAVVSVMMGLLDPGDNALIPSPHYGTYGEAARMIGGELIPVPTTVESNFTIDVGALAAAITPATKALIMVTPSNPTGTVLPEATLREVAALAIERDLVVVADEIYEHYVFGGHRHVSMATLPGMRERTITLNSLSKGYALTGVRVGYVAAPEAFIDAFMPFHHTITICANAVAQAGAAAALAHPRDWFDPILRGVRPAPATVDDDPGRRRAPLRRASGSLLRGHRRRRQRPRRRRVLPAAARRGQDRGRSGCRERAAGVADAGFTQIRGGPGAVRHLRARTLGTRS